jgi:Pyruvate/2-oxoacid:ferredoxin oxidoreductase gamma subunit
MDPLDARQWVAEKMIPVFPLGVFRDRKPVIPDTEQPPQRPLDEVLGLKGNQECAPVVRQLQSRSLSLKIAGFGGQGVLLLGQFVTEMGMSQGLEVSWLPSYGPEMRSGSAHCHVCVARERIGSPLVSQPDVLIAMNEMSLRKFASQVREGGLILYNHSELPADNFLPDAKVVRVPASDIADTLGSPKVANVVMLGALLAETGCLPRETAMATIKKLAAKRPELLALNQKALDAGCDYILTQVEVGAVSQPDGFCD